MTQNDDHAQLPLERLAAALLQRVREDSALTLRSAANDDDGMASRLASLPMMRIDEPIAVVPLDLPGAADAEDLESLVALALETAHNAADMANDARQESRRARRCMLGAVVVGVAGLALAAAGTLGAWLRADAGPPMAQLAGQMQAIDDLQHHISAQLTALQSQPAQRPAPVAMQTLRPASPALPPLPTVQVRVLPAVPALPAVRPTQASQPFAAAGSIPATQAAALPHQPPVPDEPVLPARRVAYEAVYRPYHPIVLPWPAVYVIGTLRRDMRVLFR